MAGTDRPTPIDYDVTQDRWREILRHAKDLSLRGKNVEPVMKRRTRSGQADQRDRQIVIEFGAFISQRGEREALRIRRDDHANPREKIPGTIADDTQHLMKTPNIQVAR